MNLATVLFICGLLHLGILIASALVPQVLSWEDELSKLNPLTRQLVWVHGAFIVLVIVSFGILSMVFATELADGGVLARGVCTLIAGFWLARLSLQFVLFKPTPFLTSVWLKIGYHCLTVTFAILSASYGYAAAMTGA